MTLRARFPWLVRLLAILPAAVSVGWLLAPPGAPRRGSSLDAAAVPPEVKEMRRLEAEMADVQLRLTLKAELLQDLVDGRKSLLEVAGPFLVLQRQHEARFPDAPRLFAGLPAAERACRLVIHSARSHLFNQPERARAVCARLEEEFQRSLEAETLDSALASVEEEVAP
jgi:hypothetical protein